MGEEAILCKHWAQGSAGIEELAHKVAELAESGRSQFAPLYSDELRLFEKIDTIVKRIYQLSPTRLTLFAAASNRTPHPYHGSEVIEGIHCAGESLGGWAEERKVPAAAGSFNLCDSPAARLAAAAGGR